MSVNQCNYCLKKKAVHLPVLDVNYYIIMERVTLHACMKGI